MRLQDWCITVVNTTAFHHFCATCTGCASLNASSFIWSFLCSAVATRLHRSTWRETYSRQTRTTRGDDCNRRRLRGCLCVAHDYERSGCYTARVERSAGRHRFCTVTGHFQAALKDSSVWTIVRLTTDPVTCSRSFAYGRINTVVNNNNNNKCVSRTDTNPPFAFDITFFGQGFTGFLDYRGYTDG